jgi:hypothetical protein
MSSGLFGGNQDLSSPGAIGGTTAAAATFTSLTATGRVIQSVNGAASAPPVSLTGTWFSGGTATTTKPQCLIEPAGTTSTLWSTGGTGLGVNAPSGFTGNLLDLQINGGSTFVVNSAGRVGIGTAGPSVNYLTTVNGSVKSTGFGTGNSVQNGFELDIQGLSILRSGVYVNIVYGISGDLILIPTQGQYISLKTSSSGPQVEQISISTAGLLAFKGRTASFPGLKSSSATLQVRLADDSDYTTIDALHRLQGSAPSTATSTGTTGDLRSDGSYVYVCTATNTWKRASLTTW